MSINFQHLLLPIHQFLQCSTPQAWIDKARLPQNLPVLLIDHLVCELKAAQSAMLLIRRYAIDKTSDEVLLAWLKPYEDFTYRKQGKWQELAGCNTLKKAMLPKVQSENTQNTVGINSQDLINKMVLLIKEELHHFYQVLEIMAEFDVAYHTIASSRYAKGLLSKVKTHEPDILVDKLICGAYIEARSCERFAALAPYVDKRLGDFYLSLLRSEARHYQDYLSLAEQIAGQDISDRVAFFGEIEAALIVSPDKDFKFHSGLPV